MNYSREEWLDIFKKCRVIEKLNIGVTVKALAIDIQENGYECSYNRLKKALDRYFNKSEEQGLYYEKDNEVEQKRIDYMNKVDVEATTEEIAEKRYYECFKEGFWERDEREVTSVKVDTNIYEDYKKLSKKYHCDFDEEFFMMVLLEGLEKYDPVNRLEEFIEKSDAEEAEEESKYRMGNIKN